MYYTYHIPSVSQDPQTASGSTMSYAHYLPFMMPGANGEMATLFSQVVKSMASVHNGGGSIEALKNLATEW